MPRYRLSRQARADVVDILEWSERRFGRATRQRYQALILIALDDVAADPLRIGSVDRPELGPAVRTYHLRHSRDRARIDNRTVESPRHLLIYRVIEPGLIGVGRIVHDAMEMERHRPLDYGEPKARPERPS